MGLRSCGPEGPGPEKDNAVGARPPIVDVIGFETEKVVGPDCISSQIAALTCHDSVEKDNGPTPAHISHRNPSPAPSLVSQWLLNGSPPNIVGW